MDEILNANALITAYKSILSNDEDGVQVYEATIESFDIDEMRNIVSNLVAMNIALTDFLATLTNNDSDIIWETFCRNLLQSAKESEEENDNKPE